MKTTMLVFASRPEAIKVYPMGNELKPQSEIKTLVCATEQYCQMLYQISDAFNVVSDYDLSIMQEKINAFLCKLQRPYNNIGLALEKECLLVYC